MEVATSTPPSRGHHEGSHEHVCETLRRGPETRSELHQDSPVAQPHALRELRSRGSKTQTFRTGRVPTTSRASATCGGGLGDYVFVLKRRKGYMTKNKNKKSAPPSCATAVHLFLPGGGQAEVLCTSKATPPFPRHKQKRALHAGGTPFGPF